MNEKITLQDLVELLSIKLDITKKHADIILRGFFEVIEEALAAEKYVKIKGFGTFKLTEVDSRESMNVNTGERIEIQGHTKISFTPDTTMKDLINKPFSHFETVVLNEGVQLEDTLFEEESKLEETIDEKAESIAEEQEVQRAVVEEEIPIKMEENSVQEVDVKVEEEAPSKDEPVDVDQLPERVEESQPMVVEEPEEPVIVEEVFREETEIQESFTEEEVTVEEIVGEEAANVEVAEEEVPESVEEVPAEEPKSVEPVEESITVEEEKEESQSKKIPLEVIDEPNRQNDRTMFRVLIGIIIVLVLIILFGLYWMFMRSDSIVDISPVSMPVQETTVDVVQEEPVQKEDTLQMNPDTLVTVQPEVQEQVTVLSEDVEYTIAGTIETLTLEPGQTLVKLALKYYGSKNFWPYIVQHNPDIIKDADVVPIGATIKIPKLEPKK